MDNRKDGEAETAHVGITAIRRRNDKEPQTLADAVREHAETFQSSMEKMIRRIVREELSMQDVKATTINIESIDVERFKKALISCQDTAIRIIAENIKINGVARKAIKE